MRYVLLALAFGLLLPSVAAGAPARVLAIAESPLVTDGVRFASYPSTPTTLRILDTRTGHRRSVQLPTGCQVDDGADGHFLVNCMREPGAAPYVLDARTGELFQIPGEGQLWFPAAEDFSSIGRRWLRGVNAGNGHAIVEYLDWHTGQTKSFGEADNDPVVPRDLNAPGLTPIGRATPGLFQRRGAYTLSEPFGAHRSPLVLKRRAHHTITLDTCGGGGCGSPFLSSRFVTWSSGTTVNAYVLASGRRLTWRASAPLAGVENAVQQTLRTVFFSVPHGSEFRVLRATLPR